MVSGENSLGFDFTVHPSRLAAVEKERPTVQRLLEEAIVIRRIPLEPLPPNLPGRVLCLNVARGIWTPIDYDKGVLYKIPVIIYSSDENPVVRADENFDIDRTISIVMQLEPENTEAEVGRRKVLEGIGKGKFKNICVLNAHGKPIYDYAMRTAYWGYYDKDKKPWKVSEAVDLLSSYHDLIIASVCNEGRSRLPKSLSTLPCLLPLRNN